MYGIGQFVECNAFAYAWCIIVHYRAMCDGSSTNTARIALMKKACKKHALLYKDAMNGRGFDRHLFGLYVACKGLGHVREIAIINQLKHTQSCSILFQELFIYYDLAI